MKLLVLGGTQFVGRRIAERAIERGHTVTLFHRGKTNPGLNRHSPGRTQPSSGSSALCPEGRILR